MRNGTAKNRQLAETVAANLDQRIRWDDLRIFLATCRAGTVSAVAQTLGIDNTTVSRKIQRLEKSLKTKLFERRNTGYRPTRSGEKLLRTAERVESTIVQGESELADRDVSLTGVVRVGSPDGFGSFFLAPRLAGFCQTNPELEIQLIATARGFSLSKREADIAIALALPAQGRVIGRKLTDYRLGLYASRSYVKAHPKIRRIEDLKEHLFISYIDEFLYTPLLDYVGIVSKAIAPRFKSAHLFAQCGQGRQRRRHPPDLHGRPGQGTRSAAPQRGQARARVLPPAARGQPQPRPRESGGGFHRRGSAEKPDPVPAGEVA